MAQSRTTRQEINKLLFENPYSVHPSRLEEWQDREAIKFLAEEIDSLKKIITKLTNES